MLSIVAEAEGHTVYVHADAAGLDLLERTVRDLKDALEAGECEHGHLMSASWGSSELTETMLDGEKSKGCRQVHHVKLYSWTEKWVKEHGL